MLNQIFRSRRCTLLHHAFPAWMIPTMTPKRPRADPKISIIRIFTKVEGVWASAKAQPAPVTPTQTPQKRFESPTDRPAPKRANALYRA